MKYVLLMISMLFSTLSWSAPKSELWVYWNQSNEQNQSSISHHVWQDFLDSYLVKEGENTLVSYHSVSDLNKAQLNTYIKQLEQVNPLDYSKNEQYAYWVNLYNAVTVDLILEAYPIKSITKLGGIFSFGPWGDDVVKVNGKDLTLNDIEHRILRPIWQDARTHYAVNCASLGCPNLQQAAFTASNTDALLEQAATQFISSKKGVHQQGDQLILSSIYEWFSEDFGNKQSLTKHLEKYQNQPINLNQKVSYEYDWSLNESK